MATRDGFDFERLDVYQRSLKFVSAIYDLTRTFPKEEQFGITAQFRRAAVSIPSNLAEGVGRYSANERRQFYRTARASLFECVALMELALQQKYFSQSDRRLLYDESLEISRMISGLIRAL